MFIFANLTQKSTLRNRSFRRRVWHSEFSRFILVSLQVLGEASLDENFTIDMFIVAIFLKKST